MNYLGKCITGLALVCLLAPAVQAANVPGGAQLTQEQTNAARQIFNDNFAKMDATRRALTAKRAALDAELASQTPDRGKIESLSREIGELRGQMLSSRVAVRSQLEEKGLPADYYGPEAGADYGTLPPPPMPMMGWYGRGYYGHHGRGHGYHGPRGGWCGGCGW